MTRNHTSAIAGAVVVIAVLAVLSGGVGASASDDATLGHGAENGNYTVNLPFPSDHYPRGANPGGPYNASINHYAASTPELLAKKGAEKGIEQVGFIIISNQDIDFSNCATENTGAFGVDRDNDDPGTETDIDLLQYRENSKFKDHSIVVNFFEGDELAAQTKEDRGGPGEHPEKQGQGREDGDKNAEIYPDDEIVSHQGYKSGGGPCYGMPTEPGWYQINGFLNGTSFEGEYVELNIPSHYFYVCECDSEREAYEQLGAPPGQENPYGDGGGGGSTPTATVTATDSNGGESEGASTPTDSPTATATATATATDSPTPTPTAPPTTTTAASDGGGGAGAGGAGAGGAGAGGATVSVTATAGGGGNADAGGGGGGGGGSGAQRGGDAQEGAAPATPTVGSGPGFGAVAALGALVGAALLARRRD